MLEGLRLLPPVPGRDRGPRAARPPPARRRSRQGMKVHTQTERLGALRKGVMELYISDHPLDCLTCAANGDCELQDMAGEVGLREVRYGYDGENHVFAKPTSPTTTMPKDESNPYFTFDPSKCIVCSRCVRACEEVQGTFALTIDGRGFDSRVSAGMTEPFLDSECVSCGACVQACPTATLTEKIGHRDRPAGALAWSRPAPIAASAARSRRRCRATRSCAWCPTRTARRTTAIPASRAASPGATRPTRTASPSR